jgi:hypothetical protein
MEKLKCKNILWLFLGYFWLPLWYATSWLWIFIACRYCNLLHALVNWPKVYFLPQNNSLTQENETILELKFSYYLLPIKIFIYGIKSWNLFQSWDYCSFPFLEWPLQSVTVLGLLFWKTNTMYVIMNEFFASRYQNTFF